MIDDFNRVYYKIYKSRNIKDKLTVICFQWFDESDYDEERFFKDKEGKVLEFSYEDEAIQWLKDNIKEEFIDPKYFKKNEKIILDNDYFK